MNIYLEKIREIKKGCEKEFKIKESLCPSCKEKLQTALEFLRIELKFLRSMNISQFRAGSKLYDDILNKIKDIDEAIKEGEGK